MVASGHQQGYRHAVRATSGTPVPAAAHETGAVAGRSACANGARDALRRRELHAARPAGHAYRVGHQRERRQARRGALRAAGRGQRAHGHGRQTLRDRLRDAPAGAMERRLLRPAQRRQRRRSRARLRQARRQPARQRARARLRGLELGFRARRPSEPRRRARRRQLVRLRQAGAPRLRLHGERHAHADREEDRRALLRPASRVLVHGRLLERRAACARRRDAARARVRRLPRGRAGLQPAAGLAAARLGHAELRARRQRHAQARCRATTCGSWRTRVRAQCDALDGAADGIVGAIAQCQQKFDIKKLRARRAAARPA